MHLSLNSNRVLELADIVVVVDVINRRAALRNVDRLVGLRLSRLSVQIKKIMNKPAQQTESQFILQKSVSLALCSCRVFRCP